MKSQIETTTGSSLTNLETKRPVVMNDDDVNRMFGWALFKVQKKYNKLSKNDCLDTEREEKQKIVSDICVYIKDIIHDEDYVRMYYPIDEGIRNKGRLTLIHPLYCSYFSNILNTIKRVIKYMVEKNGDVIPDKEIIKKRMNMNYIEDHKHDINGIIVVMKKRVIIPHMKDEDLNSIVWELIERILNATIGEIVRNYRRDALVRVNTVAFRTELAVKSEKK